MPQLITPEEAAAAVPDGAVLMVGGNGGTGVAESVLAAIERRFLDEGRPQGLTLIHVTGVGVIGDETVGLDHLAHQGLVRRVIGGHYGLQLRFMRELITTGAIEAYNFPQGVLAQMTRAWAAGQPGVLTHVGLGTYMDPRQEGGRMNAAAREPLIDLIELRGREWLLYRAPVPDVAILRGTTADEDGYVTMEHEGTTREDLSIAQAVRNHGGTVIVQVKRLARRGALHPQMVKIPGFLVDHLVLVPDQQQTYGTAYDPSRSGEMPRPARMILPDPLTVRRLMARRAAFELTPGAVVNLGVGVSAGIPNVAAEEGIDDLLTFTVEAGVIGGVPGQGPEFGTAVNPRAIIDQPYQFDFYDGGGLDIAFLSFAEVDGDGHVNVTRFGDRNDGAGGFIDITQNTRRLVFSGTLTGGGLKASITPEGLRLETEGRVRKFVERVGQISYNGRRGQERGQEALFVTERAVFRTSPEGLVLTEIAPGVRLEEDVLAQMAVRPHIAPDLRPMDLRLFRPGPMGLRALLAGRR